MMMIDLNALKALQQHAIFCLFLHEGHYLNPLVPHELKTLKGTSLLESQTIQQLIEQEIPNHLSELQKGLYFPTPIARTMEAGKPFSVELAQQYYYAFIEVDSQHEWYLKGNRVEGKIKSLFLQHLAYESSINTYFIEYPLEQRWDKCYLHCETTPITSIGLEGEFGASWKVLLNNDKQDTLNPQSFALDEQEHLFAQSTHHGLVQVMDPLRFQIMESFLEKQHGIEIKSIED